MQVNEILVSRPADAGILCCATNDAPVVSSPALLFLLALRTQEAEMRIKGKK